MTESVTTIWDYPPGTKLSWASAFLVNENKNQMLIKFQRLIFSLQNILKHYDFAFRACSVTLPTTKRHYNSWELRCRTRCVEQWDDDHWLLQCPTREYRRDKRNDRWSAGRLGWPGWTAQVSTGRRTAEECDVTDHQWKDRDEQHDSRRSPLQEVDALTSSPLTPVLPVWLLCSLIN